MIEPSKHAQRHRLYEERRRRDNINEKGQELAHLGPMHRLEDEKARKHIPYNPPHSPILATPRIPARRRSIRSLSNKGVASYSYTIRIGMAGPTTFDSWMERTTAEFFHKLASIKQTVADDMLNCRAGLEGSGDQE